MAKSYYGSKPFGGRIMSEEEKEIMPILKVRRLSKSYGQHDVVKDISFEVNRRQVFTILGHNGVGKSTLVDCIVGLKPFESGEVFIDGYSITEEPVEAKKVFGYVPSEPKSYEMMTGKEYLAFIAGAYDMRQEDFARNMAALTQEFKLTPFDLRRKISEYSHGMKQKICLMASLIHDPDLWVMDEPTVGLDPQVLDVLTLLIRNLANNGRAVLIISHNIEFVTTVSTDIAIMNDGIFQRIMNKRSEKVTPQSLRTIYDGMNKEKKGK